MKLEINNETLLDGLFLPEDVVVVPTEDRPYESNAIVWRNVIVYGGQGCLTSNTKILTPEGEKLIKNIKESDVVLSWDFESKRLGYSKVTKIWRYSTEELYYIRVSDGRELVCSEEHRFYTGKGWKRAKSLKVGETLYSMGAYGKANQSIARGMGLFSRDSRRGRNSIPEHGQGEDYKEGLDAYPYSGDKQLFEGFNRMDSLEATLKEGCKGNQNADAEILPEERTFQTERSLQDQTILQDRSDRICLERDFEKDTTLSQSEEEACRTYVGILNKPEIGTKESRQELFSQRTRYLLGVEEAELKPITVTAINRKNEKETTLCDIATTFGNYFAEGILVHNSGKSEGVRALVEQAVKKYGPNNVNAIQVPATKLELAFGFLDNKKVNIVFIDDFTLVKHKPETLQRFFEIRHIWSERTGRKNGYIITVIGIHRFHSLQLEFRNVFDYLLLRSSPDSLYDRQFLEQYFSSKSLDNMRNVEIGRLKDRKLFSYSLWRDKLGNQGFLELPMAEKNYLDEIKMENGRVSYGAKKKERRVQKKSRKPKFSTVFLSILAVISLFYGSTWAMRIGLLFGVFCLWVIWYNVTHVPGEKEKRGTRHCVVCEKPLSVEEIREHRDFCDNCWFEDLSTSMIYDQPDESL